MRFTGVEKEQSFGLRTKQALNNFIFYCLPNVTVLSSVFN